MNGKNDNLPLEHFLPKEALKFYQVKGLSVMYLYYYSSVYVPFNITSGFCMSMHSNDKDC